MTDVILKVGEMYFQQVQRNDGGLVSLRSEATEFNIMHDDGEIARAIELISYNQPEVISVTVLDAVKSSELDLSKDLIRVNNLDFMWKEKVGYCGLTHQCPLCEDTRGKCKALDGAGGWEKV